MFNAKSLLDALVSAGSQIGAQGGQQGIDLRHHIVQIPPQAGLAH